MNNSSFWQNTNQSNFLMRSDQNDANYVNYIEGVSQNGIGSVSLGHYQTLIHNGKDTSIDEQPLSIENGMMTQGILSQDFSENQNNNYSIVEHPEVVNILNIEGIEDPNNDSKKSPQYVLPMDDEKLDHDGPPEVIQSPPIDEQPF